MFTNYNQVYYGQSNSGGYYPEPAARKVVINSDPEHDRKYPPAPEVKQSHNSGREFWVENSRSQPQAPTVYYDLPELPKPGDILPMTQTTEDTSQDEKKDAA